jgi:hypothetical protein
MDPSGRDPLLRSFERHRYAEVRSARTVTTHLIAVRQADAFLRSRGTSLEAATRADLEAFMAHLVAARWPAPLRSATTLATQPSPRHPRHPRSKRTLRKNAGALPARQVFIMRPMSTSSCRIARVVARRS